MPNTDLTALIQDFVTRIIAATEADAAERVQAALAGAFGKQGSGRQAMAGKTAAGRKPMTVTPKVAQARKLQGQYLGSLRALGAGDKAKVKAVAKEKGVAAAVKLALSLKKK